MAEKKKLNLVLRHIIAVAVTQQLNDMLLVDFGIRATHETNGGIVLSFSRRDKSPTVHLFQANGDFYFNTGRLERIYLSSISPDEPVENFVHFLTKALEHKLAKL